MDAHILERANSIQEEIRELEDFMFWCSGKRDGGRKYKAAIVAIRRKGFGAIDRKDYTMNARIMDKVSKCIQEELDLLNAELADL